MATLEALKRRLEGAKDLQSIVKAMKSLSAVRIRQFREAVAALGGYADTLELGFQILLRDQRDVQLPAPDEDARRVVIIYGAEQGLAGQFNTRILEAAERALAGADLFVVGERLAGRLTASGRTIARRFPAPGSVDAITRLVGDLVMAIQTWREEQGVERFVLFYNRYTGGASYEPRRVELLPLDRDWLDALRHREWSGPSLPMHRESWPTLFRAVLREYLFIALYRGCAESLASENASRLSAMEAAESRIEERREELQRRYNRQRQQAITEELLEIVAGFEALEADETTGADDTREERG